MPDLIEGTRCSRVTFVASKEQEQRMIELRSMCLDGLQRVREPVSRSKAGVQGKVADVANGRSRHAESQNELKAFRVVMATARSDAWQEQPFVLEYQHEGKRHRYTPDILIAWGAHQEAVEIKEDSDAESLENQTRFALIRELLAEHGVCFRVWKKSEICAEPRLKNAALILRYRTVVVPAREHEEIRRMFSSTPELPLRAFGGDPKTVQHVLRLVLDGTLHLDWWEPLCLDSRMSTTPIGQKVWPFPPADFQEVACRCVH